MEETGICNLQAGSQERPSGEAPGHPLSSDGLCQFRARRLLSLASSFNRDCRVVHKHIVKITFPGSEVG